MYKHMRTRIPARSIFTTQAANGTGSPILVADFKNLMLELSTASSANLTIKIQGSIADVAPDFSAAASASNPWAYIASYNIENPSSIIVGSTGISFVGTDAVYFIMPNVDGLNYICATVSGYAAGNVNLKLTGYDNQ